MACMHFTCILVYLIRGRPIFTYSFNADSRMLWSAVNRGGNRHFFNLRNVVQSYRPSTEAPPSHSNLKMADVLDVEEGGEEFEVDDEGDRKTLFLFRLQ